MKKIVFFRSTLRFACCCCLARPAAQKMLRPNLAVDKTASPYQEISDKNEAFYHGYFQAVGRGGDSQAMAVLAARTVAQARLVEIVHGLEVERETRVEGGKLKKDVVRVNARGAVRFASVCGETYYPDKGSAIVCMRLYLKSGNVGDLVEHLLQDASAN